jgi:hypothetical protein
MKLLFSSITPFLPFWGTWTHLLCPDPTLGDILSGHLLSKFTLSTFYELATHNKETAFNTFAA